MPYVLEMFSLAHVFFLQVILMWSLSPEHWVSVRSRFGWWETCAAVPNPAATFAWRRGATLIMWSTNLPWMASWSRWSEKGCGPAWRRLRWRSGRGPCQRRNTATFAVPSTFIRSCRTMCKHTRGTNPNPNYCVSPLMNCKSFATFNKAQCFQVFRPQPFSPEMTVKIYHKNEALKLCQRPPPWKNRPKRSFK